MQKKKTRKIFFFCFFSEEKKKTSANPAVDSVTCIPSKEKKNKNQPHTLKCHIISPLFFLRNKENTL